MRRRRRRIVQPFVEINAACVADEACELMRPALNSFWEVELRLGAFEPQSRIIVCDGCILSGVERPEPNSCCFLWVPDLGRPFPPGPLPDSSIMLSPRVLYPKSSRIL